MKIGSAPEARLKLPAIRHTTPKKQAAAASVNAAWALHRTAKKNTADAKKIQIDCKAHECTYNEHCKCTAAAIDIDGPNADKSNETKCSTFSCKC